MSDDHYDPPPVPSRHRPPGPHGERRFAYLVPVALFAASQGDQRILTENRKVLAVVLGLVAVAVALSVLTFAYWRRTRPVRSSEPGPARARPDSTARTADRMSRQAVAGADHHGADGDWQSHATGEHKRIEPTARPAGSRPPRPARRVALERDTEHP